LIIQFEYGSVGQQTVVSRQQSVDHRLSALLLHALPRKPASFDGGSVRLDRLR